MRLHDYLTRLGVDAGGAPALTRLRTLLAAHRETFLF
jgi:hypothetical protein